MTSSLFDYARTTGAKPDACGVCRLPEEARQDIEANETLPREQRLPRSVVRAWLFDTFGVGISRDAIYRHVKNHAHRDDD